MREKKFICQECGKEFVTNASFAKYCLDCRKTAYTRLARAHSVRRLVDTDEMKKMCLNCTQPKCAGQCAWLATLARGV